MEGNRSTGIGSKLTWAIEYQIGELRDELNRDQLQTEWIIEEANAVEQAMDEVLGHINNLLNLSISTKDIDSILQDWRERRLANADLLKKLKLGSSIENSGSSMLDRLAALRPFENDIVRFEEEHIRTISAHLVGILNRIEEFRTLAERHNLSEFRLKKDFSEIRNEMKECLARIKALFSIKT